jgi:hypothetical protein
MIWTLSYKGAGIFLPRSLSDNVAIARLSESYLADLILFFLYVF